MSLWRYIRRKHYDIIGLKFHPRDINRKGHIIGTDIKENPLHYNACMMDEVRAIFDLGSIGSYGCCLNDSGTILIVEPTHDNSQQLIAIKDAKRFETPIDFYTHFRQKHCSLNNKNQVVGTRHQSQPYFHQPYFWDIERSCHFILECKQTPGGEACHIDEDSKIVGSLDSTHAQGVKYPVFWEKPRGYPSYLSDTNTALQAGNASMSSNCWIAGMQEERLVIWNKDHNGYFARHFYAYKGTFMAINRHKKAVGRLDTRRGSRACLYNKWRIIDLNDWIDPRLGWVLESACGILDDDRIIGSGKKNGIPAGFLLEPV